MDKLYKYQEALLDQVDDRYFRPLFHEIDWSERMFGIKGPRGTGKTTLLLQYLKSEMAAKEKALYVTMDHSWFYDHLLVDLAEQFQKYGGKVLLVDEIHKYPRWSRELKNIYDGFPRLQVVFTASSALDLLKGEGDLSRRTITYELTGLSFREYLELVHQKPFPSFSLGEILEDPKQAASRINKGIRPLPYFKEYLEHGYFPFTLSEKKGTYFLKLDQVINTVLQTDLQIIGGYSPSHVVKLKKLMGVIAESAPFAPNISKLAHKLRIGRDTIKVFLQNLEQARLLNFVSKPGFGVSTLQKPDKIFLENPNLSHTLKEKPNRGTLRETFFISQLRNAGYRVELGEKADFLVEGQWHFEIGGPSKNDHQIRGLSNAYLVLDDTEHAFLNRIPLWMFGFLG